LTFKSIFHKALYIQLYWPFIQTSWYISRNPFASNSLL